jgi:hypothetical protein
MAHILFAVMESTLNLQKQHAFITAQFLTL